MSYVITAIPSITLYGETSTGSSVSYGTENVTGSTSASSATTSNSETSSTEYGWSAEVAVETTISWSPAGKFSAKVGASGTYGSASTVGTELATSQELSEQYAESVNSEKTEGTSYNSAKLGLVAEMRNAGHVSFCIEYYSFLSQTYAGDGALAWLGNMEPDTISTSFPAIAVAPGASFPMAFVTEIGVPTGQALLASGLSSMIFEPGGVTLTADCEGNTFLGSAELMGAKDALIMVDWGPTALGEDVAPGRYLVAASVEEDGVLLMDALATVGLTAETGERTVVDADGVELGTANRLVAMGDRDTEGDHPSGWLVSVGAMDDSTSPPALADDYDFDAVRLMPGQAISLVYVSDDDGDGVGNRTELAFGSDGSSDDDSDGDGLTDAEETVVGWQTPDGQWMLSDARTADLDGDGVTDPDELRRGTTAMGYDSDLDGITDDRDWGPLARVATNGDQTCSLSAAGGIACWGEDETDPVVTDAPVGMFVDFAVGYSHACAVDWQGYLACWGSDASHQVTDTPTGAGFAQVAAGRGFSCALDTDGAVTCWGGISSAPSETGFTDLALAQSTACALSSSGTLNCWGDNIGAIPTGSFDSLSRGYSPDDICALDSAGAVSCLANTSGLTGAYESLTVGDGVQCGIDSSGQAECSGPTYHLVGEYVALGADDLSICGVSPDGVLNCAGPDLPPDIGMPGTEAWTQVSAGFREACAIGSTGAMVCWGDLSERDAYLSCGKWTTAGTGRNDWCGVGEDGSVTCWGDSADIAAGPTASAFTDVYVGNTAACGVEAGGAGIECWGPATDDLVANAPSGAVTQLYLGGNTVKACALTTAGLIKCWGQNSFSDPTSGSGAYAGVATVGGSYVAGLQDGLRVVEFYTSSGFQGQTTFASDILQLSFGSTYLCALDTSGSVECGKVSGGAYTKSTSVVAPSGTYTQLSMMGDDTFCGVTVDLEVKCWGDTDTDEIVLEAPGSP